MMTGDMLNHEHQRAQKPQVRYNMPKQHLAGVRLTFWWHPVFVWAARQAPMVRVQACHMTRAITAWCRTSTLLLVRT